MMFPDLVGNWGRTMAFYPWSWVPNIGAQRATGRRLWGGGLRLRTVFVVADSLGGPIMPCAGCHHLNLDSLRLPNPRLLLAGSPVIKTARFLHETSKWLQLLTSRGWVLDGRVRTRDGMGFRHSAGTR